MKVGIITFHWATNYGAILQTYALQTALENLGTNVEIINYKPSKFDYSFRNFFNNRRFLHLCEYCKERIKENNLKKFRKDKLKCSRRYFNEDSLSAVSNEYDVLITGSDQVMNSYFLQYGEKGGSTAYFLGFGDSNTRKLAYAVSFGTVNYPKDLCKTVNKLIARFYALSVRENSGVEIIKSMGRNDALLVPDPTLLLNITEYKKLLPKNLDRKEITFVYLLHNRKSFLEQLQKKSNSFPLKISAEEGLIEWLSNIYTARAMITNSYHGVIFCLIFHIPFVVVLPTLNNEGMNDRFFTLLDRLGLSNRIRTEENFDISLLHNIINWDFIDKTISDFREIGLKYLKENITKS